MSLAEASALELAAAFRAGADPVEHISACLDVLHGPGRETGVVLAVDDGAVDAAAVSRRRLADGDDRPLEGVPFGVKDIIATESLLTTGGAAILGDSVPRVDATCVARLRAAGAIPVAKLATSEFAAGHSTNATFGPVGNPWDPERWTGGSSTGSGAALAHRFLPLAIGTDTGGSVRIPSAWCGTTGIKPTYGWVPRTGVLPLSWTLDHVGPMARTAQDCGFMLAVMAGPDGKDPSAEGPTTDPRLWAQPMSEDLSGVRIGVVEEWFTEWCDPDVEDRWRTALAELEAAGASLVEVSLPSAHIAFTAGWELLFAEAASLHEPHLERLEEMDPGFVARMLQGRFQLAVDYLRGLRLRSVVLAEAMAVLEQVDLICTVGVPGTAPRHADLLVDIGEERIPMQQVHSRSTMYGNFTGLPALMAPSGFDRKGMPTAIQLLGRPFAETELVRVAAAFQHRTDHHLRAPSTVDERSGVTVG